LAASCAASSEFPFLPGVQKAVRYLRSGQLGHALEIRSAFTTRAISTRPSDQLETAEPILR